MATESKHIAPFPYCQDCGSLAISADTSVYFDQVTERWEIGDGALEGLTCITCDSPNVESEEDGAGKIAQCDNCGQRCHKDHLRPVEDLAQRVEPGEPMPCGECPECRAVCHLWTPPAPNAAKAEAEAAYAANRDNDELQIDRAEPESRIMHGAIWVKSWTRVRPVEGAL